MDHFWDYTRLEVSKYGLLGHYIYNKALAKEDNLHILVSKYIATLKCVSIKKIRVFFLVGGDFALH